jgi:hypothetical protein
VGHDVTASIAQAFLQPHVLSELHNLTDFSDLSEISNWADAVKYSHKYSFSRVLHYVNPSDDEPNVCSFRYAYDCPRDRCIVGAIQNYTRRLDPRSGFSRSQRVDALKFVVHFVGDVHQPLHVSGRQKGGNDAPVHFLGKKTKLHAVWDALIIEKRIYDVFQNDIDLYVKHLVEMAECTFLNIASSPPITEIKKETERWTNETIKVNCATVWPGYDNSNDGILDDRYYEDAICVVDNLLAQAGTRLAQTLNRIFDPQKN